MKEWLVFLSEHAIIIIDGLALVMVVIGTIEAVFYIFTDLLNPAVDGVERRKVWLGYVRWLVAALTFQLAADVIETAIRTDWQSLGRIAAIAVIRTFLNYFLEKDIGEIRLRQREKKQR